MFTDDGMLNGLLMAAIFAGINHVTGGWLLDFFQRHPRVFVVLAYSLTFFDYYMRQI
ncbi:hypothetical protein [Bdellovibrio sp. HCB209]|uniref:hypothetical protein n=1 Tax=Bdellovibrio sp. HCB209 TaxID=3394354 RepID=UPI0039B4F158